MNDFVFEAINIHWRFLFTVAAVGCEIFHGGSSLLILNQTRNCEPKAECLHGEKEIDIAKATECSLVANQVQYLHKDQWISLLVENEPFKIETSEKKTLLKVNTSFVLV